MRIDFLWIVALVRLLFVKCFCFPFNVSPKPPKSFFSFLHIFKKSTLLSNTAFQLEKIGVSIKTKVMLYALKNTVIKRKYLLHGLIF